MNHLWVYGCSFSEPFGFEQRGPLFDKDGYRQIYAEFWGTHLAKSLNCKLRCKSISGIGWNYINEKIDEDFGYWSKDDTIVISPSFFSRVTFEETVSRSVQIPMIDFFKPLEEVIALNIHRWKSKINSLQRLGFNVFTWLVEDFESTHDVKNLILADGLYSFKDWMDQHHEYWTDPTTNKYPLGDWHFNQKGHLAVADIMHKFITK